MRVLSARIRDIAVDRSTRRVAATVHLVLLIKGVERRVALRTSAPITTPGAARLKHRLIAAAKLMVAMRVDEELLPDAMTVDSAA